MQTIIVLTCIFMLFFIFLYVLFYMTFHNSPRRHRKHKSSLKIKEEHRPKIREIHENLKNSPFEQIYIKNREGKRLAARYYYNRDDAPVAIMFHGYRSRAMSDCGGGFRIFSDNGINVLIPDQRAHGESEGRAITFGIKEKYDCLDWVNYINKRFDKPDIILVGVSMGAATVLMASGVHLPENVKGIIADCSYSSPEAIIRKVISDMKLPHKLFFPFVRLAGMVYGGFDICSDSPVHAVVKSRIPILLIHGEADDFVPYSMMSEIKAACECNILSIPDAEHGVSYIVDTETYQNSTQNFLNNIL